ncbi:MAG: hypothetical protein QME81_18255 [bacterium]|nr:hypothetical protein [bacterium]
MKTVSEEWLSTIAIDFHSIVTSTKGTVTVPLSDGSIYTVSVIFNDSLFIDPNEGNRELGEGTFTTSDNWTGKVEYKNDWGTYTYPDGFSKHLLGRTVKGCINDENGNKIAIIDYYENVQALGRYIYYTMVDDPNQEVHKIELNPYQ